MNAPRQWPCEHHGSFPSVPFGTWTLQGRTRPSQPSKLQDTAGLDHAGLTASRPAGRPHTHGRGRGALHRGRCRRRTRARLRCHTTRREEMLCFSAAANQIIKTKRRGDAYANEEQLPGGAAPREIDSVVIIRSPSPTVPGADGARRDAGGRGPPVRWVAAPVTRRARPASRWNDRSILDQKFSGSRVTSSTETLGTTGRDCTTKGAPHPYRQRMAPL